MIKTDMDCDQRAFAEKCDERNSDDLHSFFSSHGFSHILLQALSLWGRPQCEFDPNINTTTILNGKPLSASVCIQMIDLWQVSFSELTCLWRQAGRTTRVCVSGKLSETANGRLKKNLGCQVFARSKISPPSGQLHCVWDNKSGLQVVQESRRQMRRHKCLDRLLTELHNVLDLCR